MWSPVGALPPPLPNGALCFTDGFVTPGGADVLVHDPATGDWTLATGLTFIDEQSLLTAAVGSGPGFSLDGCLVFTGPFVYRTSALSVLLVYQPSSDPAAAGAPGTLTLGTFAGAELIWAPVELNPPANATAPTEPPALRSLDQLYWPGYGFGQVARTDAGWQMQWVSDVVTRHPASSGTPARGIDPAPPDPYPEDVGPVGPSGAPVLPADSPAGSVFVGHLGDQGSDQFVIMDAASPTLWALEPRNGWTQGWTGDEWDLGPWEFGSCFWSNAQAGRDATAVISFSGQGDEWSLSSLGAGTFSDGYVGYNGGDGELAEPPPLHPDTLVLLPVAEPLGTVFLYEPATESWLRTTIVTTGLAGQFTWTPFTAPPLQDPWAWMTGGGPGLYYSPAANGWFTGTVGPDGATTTAMLDLSGAGADTRAVGQIRNEIMVLLGADIGAELVSDWLDAQTSYWDVATLYGAETLDAALYQDRAQLTPNPGDNVPLATLLDNLYRTLIAREQQLFDDSTDVPLILLPIRIEAAYLPAAAGWTLALRFYPDDVHVDGHDPTLTDAEVQAATTYWTDVFAAGGDQALTDLAWQRMLRSIRAPRAAWATGQLTPTNPVPSGPPGSGEAPPEPAWPVDFVSRGSASARPPQTALLPDHFTVTLINQGIPELVVQGASIPDILQLSFTTTRAEDSSGLLEPGSEWLVDLAEAVAVGMAIEIPLQSAEAFDQIIVTGVAARLTPEQAANRLESAMTAHLYSDGLEFLAPQTPTNNTAATRSAWSSAPAALAPTEASARRAAYDAASDANVAVLARAAGIDGSVALALADGAADDQLTGVATMAGLLWPVWGDGFLELTDRVETDLAYVAATPAVAISAQSRAWLRDFALGSVRGRGPLPVLRVGRQPYGLLPASSLDTWASGDSVELEFVRWLRMLRQYWAAGTAAVPRATVDPSASPDTPDQAVLDLFSREPLSVTAAGRLVARTAPPDTDDAPPDGGLGQPATFSPATMPGLDHFSQLAWQSLSSPLVTPTTPPWTSAAPIGSVSFEEWIEHAGGLFADLATLCGNPTQISTMLTGIENELGVVAGALSTSSLLWTLLANAVDTLIDSHHDLLQALISDSPAPDPTALVTAAAEFTTMANGFTVMQRFTEAELAPLAQEVIDLGSHRLDAWITALATRRLSDMRAVSGTGVRLGAFGWIETLMRDATTTPPAAAGGSWTGTSDGFVHAPSLQHAATAAVLRSAFLSHQDPTQQPSSPTTNPVLDAQQAPFAIDVSSRRMRLAQWLVTGIHAGQSLSAMLGYRAERLLTETGDPTGVIALRQQFPAPSSPSANGSQAATSTIDGLAFMKAQLGLATAGTPGAAAGQPGSDSLLYDIAVDLQEILHAAGDLLLAEAVHQLVGGNTSRASLVADALGSARVVPDRFDVLTTPRGGAAQRHHVGWIAAAGATAAGGWNPAHPRAQFNPQAECWAETILGPAASWSLTATRGDGTAVTVTLGELDVAALDVVAEATADPGSSVLAGRLAELSGGPFTAISGYAELAATTARVRACLASGRALTPADLQVDDWSPTAGLELAELSARVSGLIGYAQTSIGGLRSAATPDAQFAALAALSLIGVAGAFPLSHDADVLAAQSAAVLTRPAAVDPGAPPADQAAVATWLAAVTDAVQAIDPTLVVIPTFTVASDSDAAAAFASPPPDASTDTVMDWLAGVGRVRPTVQSLHDVLLASEVHDGPLSLQVLQTPAASGAGWIALRQTDATARASAVLHAVASPSPSQALCGMVLDQWVEVVPGHPSLITQEPSELTGVAFHYGAPDARAPQAWLLAVPPDPALGWTSDTLLQVVREVLDLAKMRGADLGDVPGLGYFLPTTYLSGEQPFTGDTSAEGFTFPTPS